MSDSVLPESDPGLGGAVRRTLIVCRQRETSEPPLLGVPAGKSEPPGVARAFAPNTKRTHTCTTRCFAPGPGTSAVGMLKRVPSNEDVRIESS